MTKLIRIVLINFLIIGILSCDEKPQPSIKEISKKINKETPYQPAPKLNFTEVSHDKGLDFTFYNGAQGEKYEPESLGGGLAFFDFDNDGDPDIVAISATQWKHAFTNSGPTTIALFRNDDGISFTNITEKLNLTFNGYGIGLAIGDYDGDGWKDIYITSLGKNMLYRNIQGLRFQDKSNILDGACAKKIYSTSAAFFDADGDNDLDLFVANYTKWNKEMDKQNAITIDGEIEFYSGPENFEGIQPCFYQNIENQKFKEIAKKVGLTVKTNGKPIGKSLGVIPVDINNDSFIDLLVSNDRVRNLVFINTKHGKFIEQGIETAFAYNNKGISTAGMGIDVAWLSPKQTLTVAIGNFWSEMSSIYRLDQKHFIFSDDAPIMGIGADSRIPVTFGVLFTDLDLDGRPEYIQVNGQIDPDLDSIAYAPRYKQSAHIFWNCSENCSQPFQLLSQENAGEFYLPIVGRGLSAADFDGDGDIDLITSEVNGQLRLFQNNQKTNNHWLKIDLRQNNKNSYSIGATVEIKLNNRWQKQLVMPGRSYLSQNPTTLIFGLGKNKFVDQIKITWPDGKIQVIKNVAANQKLTINKQNKS